MNTHNLIHLLLYIFILIIFHSKILCSNSSLLNHIIRLGDKNYRYNHFSFDSKGNMIIDTTAYPFEKERKYYGITKNGREFFTDNSGNKNYHSSITVESDKGRVEGESSFIRISSDNKYKGEERLLSISKSEKDQFLTEVVDLNHRAIRHSDTTSNYFGSITSNVFSINAYPINSDSNYYYFISYIGKGKNNNNNNNKYAFYTQKTYYKGTSPICLVNTVIKKLDCSNQTIISCFFTKTCKMSILKNSHFIRV